MKALVLTGRTLAGAEEQKVWAGVAALFKMEAADFQKRVLARCPITIQRMNDERAERLRQHLVRQGADVHVLEAGEAQWQFVLDGKPHGPVPMDYQRLAINSGTLAADTRVRCSGTQAWSTLRDALDSAQAEASATASSEPVSETPSFTAAVDSTSVAPSPNGDPPAGNESPTELARESKPTQEPACPTPALPRAGFWNRALAYAIDSFIVSIPAAVLAILISLLALNDGDDIEQVIFVSTLVLWTIYLLFGLLYWPLLEASRKQATLGKRLLELRVTDMQGQRLTLGRAYARHLASALNQLTSGIGFLLAALAPRRQGLHDRLAHTLVVDSRNADFEATDATRTASASPSPQSATKADSSLPRGFNFALGILGVAALLGAIVIAGYFLFRAYDKVTDSAVIAANQAPRPARLTPPADSAPTNALPSSRAMPSVEQSRPNATSQQGSGGGIGTLGEASRICTGKRTFIFADPDDPSPWGTKIVCNAIGNYRLSLLTDNYTRQSHDDDAVRYYALTALSDQTRAVPMFDDAFHFNKTTVEDVKRYFGDRAVESHQTIGDNNAFDMAFKVQIGNEFAYFRFRNGLLRNFALADFDIDFAD